MAILCALLITGGVLIVIWDVVMIIGPHLPHVGARTMVWESKLVVTVSAVLGSGDVLLTCREGVGGAGSGLEGGGGRCRRGGPAGGVVLGRPG